MDISKLSRPDWAFDPAVAAEHCTQFIKSTMRNAGRDQLVLGLSGGIDSAVAAGLAVKALGPEKVLGIMMPYSTSSAASLTDAQAVADCLGMKTEKTAIATMANAFLADIPAEDLVRRGNIMARCRMVLLYDRSARDGSLVLGTGNRTEALLGYTTLFGDSACALNPLAQLYKTEVRLLSAWQELPDSVLTKAPSADLWEGQSDEDELGFSYEEVDHLLHAMIDLGLDNQQLSEKGFSEDFVQKVRTRVKTMAFKRQAVPVAEFSGRKKKKKTLSSRKDGGFH
ncbi:MAG: NAD+ synthase [bacterium]|nr:NAD+ synthase [bacterium]